MKVESGSLKESYDDYPWRPMWSKSPNALTRAEYGKVIGVLGKTKFEFLKKGKKVTLCARCGSLQILKIKPKKRSFDKAHYFRTGEKLIYKNLHTDGYAVSVHWSRGYECPRNFKMWSFDLSRNNNRYGSDSLTQYVRRNGVDKYLEE